MPSDVECGLVLGGDGTLIRAIRDLEGEELPLLGINLGTLGYLAEVELKDYSVCHRQTVQEKNTQRSNCG